MGDVYVTQVPVQRSVWTLYSNGGFLFGWACVAFAPLYVLLVFCSGRVHRLAASRGGEGAGWGGRWVHDTFSAMPDDGDKGHGGGEGWDDGFTEMSDGASP